MGRFGARLWMCVLACVDLRRDRYVCVNAVRWLYSLGVECCGVTDPALVGSGPMSFGRFRFDLPLFLLLL